MRKKKANLVSLHDVLIRHPFRVRIGALYSGISRPDGDIERTLYVSSIEAATSGLPLGWGILEAHRYDPTLGAFVKIL